MNRGTFLDLQNKNITSLAGIEYFTYLETLNCMGNQLTTLDVTKLTKLTGLICAGNQLTALDVTGLTSLMILVCNDNQLTALDVTGLTSLTDLYCGNQTKAAGEPQTLTLILTSTQKDTWDKRWGSYDDNARVYAKVKD